MHKLISYVISTHNLIDRSSLSDTFIFHTNSSQSNSLVHLELVISV